MPSKDKFIKHTSAGGWTTEFGTKAKVSVGQTGVIEIPYLLNFENAVFELDGGFRKAPGAARINGTTIASGAEIRGVFDAWFSASGSPAQHRMVYAGTDIFRDDADGTFTGLSFSLNSGKIPTFAMMEDILLMAFTGADVPKEWDASTAQNLQGSPPNFDIISVHKGRAWGSGDPNFPSRLYYSAFLNPQDWIGSGSGKIDIAPDDGDHITGHKSFKGELLVFKGPFKGSIHRIQGSAPTGQDPFRKPVPYVSGVSAVWQNTIFEFQDDIGFMWSDGTVHSLKAVAAFGDYNAVSLSRPIQKYLTERINFSKLDAAWASSGCDCGYTLFTVPIDGSTTNNQTLMMDFRFNPLRWGSWPSFSSGSIASGLDPDSNDRRVFIAGGGDGFLRKYGQLTRTIDPGTADTSIDFLVTSPFLDYSLPLNTKTFVTGSLEFVPLNNGAINFRWRRDSQDVQTRALTSTAGSDPLGTVSGAQFTLGTSKLAGSSVLELFFNAEEGGEFRNIQYEMENSILGEDVEIHGFGAQINVGAESTENDF